MFASRLDGPRGLADISNITRRGEKSGSNSDAEGVLIGHEKHEASRKEL
jgi:hypothetical protein